MSEVSDAARAHYPDDDVHAISMDEWREAFEAGAQWAEVRRAGRVTLHWCNPGCPDGCPGGEIA